MYPRVEEVTRRRRPLFFLILFCIILVWFGSVRFDPVRFGSVPFGPVTIDFDNRRSISGGINRGRKKKRESKKTEKMEIIRSGVGLSLLKISSPCAKKCELKKREKMEIIRSGVGLSPQAISSPCAGERRRGCRKRGRRWKLLDPVLVFPRGRFLLPARVEKTYPCVARSNEATSARFDPVSFGPVTIDFDNRRSISGGINRERKKKRESKKR
ncbi:hypothetical protein BHM03_00056769 [Ensete ventricosum]|nr:hypothetical protein BHM03_00056769 [Ensete ventricosum]